MLRKGFTLIEIILVTVFVGIFMIIFLNATTSMGKSKSDMVLEANLFKIQRGIGQTVSQNLDSFTLSSEYIVKKTSDAETDVVVVKKNEWVPMFSLANASGTIAETTPNGTGLNGKGDAVADTSRYLAKLRAFWNMSDYKTENTPYLFVAQKYFNTVNGSIPYNDFYVLIMPEEMAKPLKTNKALREKVLDKILRIGGKECNLIDSDNPIINDEKVPDYTTCKAINAFSDISNSNDKFLDIDYIELDTIKPLGTDYVTLFQDTKYLNEDKFLALRKKIKFTTFSNKDVIQKAFDDTVQEIKISSKNLKDWASIQMVMYENIVAKLGGSFNIDYFITKTKGSVGGTTNNRYNSYVNTALYSSSYLSKSDCNRPNAGGITDVCWDTVANLIDIKDEKTTIAGMVVKKFEYGNNLESTSSYNLSVLNLNRLNTRVTGGDETMVDISLNSGLMEGSKTILGVKSSDNGYGNTFGDVYRFSFSNLEEYGISLGGGSNGYKFTQNVPSTESKYAPYSAVISTTFPWIYFKVKPNNNFFGYYEDRIVPELR